MVVPGVVDYTPQADDAFARFAQAGMQIVNTKMEVLENHRIKKSHDREAKN